MVTIIGIARIQGIRKATRLLKADSNGFQCHTAGHRGGLERFMREEQLQPVSGGTAEGGKGQAPARNRVSSGAPLQVP
jgi:hypothetical protein